MKNIAILGATGSIGTNTLQVIDLNLDKFNVFAVAANVNYQKMAEICKKYHPKYAVMVDEKSAKQLQKLTKVKILTGIEALDFIVSCKEVDIIMCAIIGSVGMQSTLMAAKSGKKIALANKESMVLAGNILTKIAQKNKAQIIPVDSEHSAIFQTICGDNDSINKIQLTASGGPFLNTSLSDLTNITPEQACSHPNWSMGRKISVDSSTMMNKGLEAIEAHYLFNMPADKIDIIIHPQSIVHSSVYFKDGSVLSQLGNADMRTAIAYSMSYPLRIQSGVVELDLSQHKLTFFRPNMDKFRCLSLALLALKQGPCAIGVLNASNEVAVEAFLAKKIKFLDIAKIIAKNLEQIPRTTISTIQDAIDNDKLARIKARELL